MSSNIISQNPALAKSLFNSDGKADKSNVESAALGAPDLVRSQLNQSGVKQDQFLPSEQGKMAAAGMMQFESAYQYSESMSLQLTTREGDTVSIDFRQLYAEYQSYRNEQSSLSAPSGVRYFESKEVMESTAFEEQFAFSVNGDLNEAELKAIFDVFERVDKLANSFFDGDIEKALTQAMALDIDFGQLQSFQLNLTQTEAKVASYQQAAVAEYDTVQEVESDYGVNMSNLPPYLEQWQMALEKLDDQFNNAWKVFDEMLGSVVTQRFPDQDSRTGWLARVQEFHGRLAEYAATQKTEPEMGDQAVEAEAFFEKLETENKA